MAPMLRITVHKEKTGATLQLEGRLAGHLVKEADRCWEALCQESPGRRFRVDLRSVTYIDSEGKAWLTRVYEQGARLLASGCLTRSYVEEITGRGG